MKRDITIDLLRGWSLLAIILIHVTVYYQGNRLAYRIWNWNQYAVAVFVFCSAYLYFKKSPTFTSFSQFAFYLKKRLLRLLIPYYLFLGAYFLFLFFSKPWTLTGSYILQNLLAIGGVDLNWLVLLFIFFLFLFPFIHFLWKNQRPLFYLYGLISLLSAVYFLFYPSLLPYRLVMWLPWSLVAVVTQLFVDQEKNQRFLLAGFLVSLLIFILSYQIQSFLGHSLAHYRNKYPPNIYHLSYSLLGLFTLLIIMRMRFFQWSPIAKTLDFLSRYSYSLYFIHLFFILVIYQFRGQRFFDWYGLLLVVIIFSVITQLLLNRLSRFLSLA